MSGARDEHRLARFRIYVAAFLVDGATFGYFVLLAKHAGRSFNATPSELGYLGTTATAMLAIASLLSGRLSDRHGSRGVYLSGVGLILAAIASAVFAKSLLGFLLVNALFGFGLGLYWPPLERQLSLLVASDSLADDSDASRQRRLWRAVGSFNGAWAFGIAVASYAAPRGLALVGFEKSVLVAVGAIVMAVAMLATLKTPDAARRRPPDEELSTPQGEARANLFLQLAWVANFGAYFAFQSLYNVFPHAHEALEFSDESLGDMLFLVGVARLALFVLLRWIKSWQYSLKTLLAFEFVTAVSLLTLSLTSEVTLFYLLLPTVGALCGLSAFSSLYYGLRRTAHEGVNSGIHEFMQALGKVSGPLLCGWAGGLFPTWPTSMLAGCAAIMVAVGLWQIILFRKAHFHDSSPPVQ